jgi:hypothetical protein
MLLLGAVAALLAAGCARRMDMYDQPKYKGLRASNFFADGKSARELVKGTVPRGALREDAHYYRGVVDDTTLARTFPMPVTRDMLQRGKERFEIFCTPCHDYLGTGRGMVVRRGFKQPPSFHQERLREAPVGYLFDVMTNGFGAMAGYASQVPVEDRWAIAAYIRALQYSQNAKLAELPAADRDAFQAALRQVPPAPEVKP